MDEVKMIEVMNQAVTQEQDRIGQVHLGEFHIPNPAIAAMLFEVAQ